MPEEPRLPRIGLVGLGRMGAAILPHLVGRCSTLMAWNRSAAKCADAARAGARIARSPRELAEACDIVLSILFDDVAVSEVYVGAQGLLSGECAGRAFVEMSTIKPETTRSIAAQAHARGASFVDAPVSGSVGPARAGKLLVLAGGTAADVQRVRPVLSLFARRIAHVGPTGSGVSMKLALQLPIYVYWQSLGESLSIGARSGLDISEMLSLIAESPAALSMLEAKIPVILQQDCAVAFALSAAAKDLGAINSTAGTLDVRVPTATAALASYQAAIQTGWGEQDAAQLVRFLIEKAKQAGD